MRGRWWLFGVLVWPAALCAAGFELVERRTGRSAAFSPDGRLLVVLLSDEDMSRTPQAEIRRLADRKLLAKRRGRSCGFSADGHWLALHGEVRRRRVVNGQAVVEGEPFLDIIDATTLRCCVNTWADQYWFRRAPAELLLHRRTGQWEWDWLTLALPSGTQVGERQEHQPWLYGPGYDCWKAPPQALAGPPAKPLAVSVDRRFLVVSVDGGRHYAIRRTGDGATLVDAQTEAPVLAGTGGFAAVEEGGRLAIWDLSEPRRLGSLDGCRPVFVDGAVWTWLPARGFSRRWRLPSLAVLDDCPGQVKWATPGRVVAWRRDDQSLALWTVGPARRLARWTDQSDDPSVEFIAGGHALLDGEDVYDSGNGRRLGEFAGDRDTGGVSATWAWVATREPLGVRLWRKRLTTR